MSGVTDSEADFETRGKRLMSFGIPVLMLAVFHFIGALFDRLEFSQSIAIQFYLLDYLFVNKIHAFWGLVFFFSIRESLDSYPKRRRAVFEFVSVFLIAFTLFVLPVFFKNLWNEPLYVFIFLLATKFVTLLHNVKQSFGISLRYVLREKNLLTRDSNARLETLIRREKKFHWLLIAGAFITPDAGFAWAFNRIAWVEYSVEFGLTLQAIALIGLFLNTVRIGKITGHQDKLKFDSRYLLYPLAHYSFAAFLAIRATHSAEYLMTIFQIMKKSKTSALVLKRLNYLIPVGGLLYAGFYLAPEIESFFSNETSLTVAIILRAAIAINVIHFYYDAKMFRMKNPRVREHMGPLLKPS